MERLLKLPKRLGVIADYIEKGAAVADIGTDHGFLPVYLAQHNIASTIIASDISAGSLASARRTAAKYGVENRIKFVTAPGLDGVGEREVDTVVISGIGGENIAGIIAAAPWLRQQRVRLILQPQTKLDKLHDFLIENGYTIRDTSTVSDRDKLYTVILAGVDMKIELQKLTIADAPQWHKLQVEAYAPLLEKYQDHETSPAAESLTQVIARISAPSREHFFILKDGEIVGGVRTAWQLDTTRFRLGGIFILPRFRDMKIGQIAMNLVEARYPDAETWELETILQEERNIHFYEKLGYRRVGEEVVVNSNMTLVSYIKEVAN
ncbi:MAG: tRNA (adenine(22)-N(1))-methyltransferase TrmK [Oscillospiraceae bacterium]|nr:tRNA (adenine(22)-N(1))-methyltransferase TrmK [Oscillospiraceae bacterium]